jgi:exopolyphosphatase/guanosine-5'-triphosphate,3'-diphosphate pyrophosphatase
MERSRNWRAERTPARVGDVAAAIDVGTNTVLLYVARRAPLGAERVYEACRTARLGEGLAASGVIGAAAADRALAVLVEYAALARAHGVQPADVHAVGTAALRRASNAAEWIERCWRATGVRVHVIAPEWEAELAFEAVAARLDDARHTRVLDVGGGSAQLASERGARRVSLPLGAVVLTESCCPSLLQGRVEPAEWQRLGCVLEQGWSALPPELEAAAGAVVWIGGSATHAACFALGLAHYDPAQGEGTVVGRVQLREWADELARLDLTPRALFPIEPERVGILPAGFACAAAALARLGAETARVSLRGLRHALVERALAGQATFPFEPPRSEDRADRRRPNA